MYRELLMLAASGFFVRKESILDSIEANRIFKAYILLKICLECKSKSCISLGAVCNIVIFI